MAKTIHVVSILDRSGSMQGTENEVIGAYNAFIKEQVKISEEKGVTIKTTLVLFDNQYEEVYSKVPVAQTPELKEDVYYTRGMTALHDAIGKTISNFHDKKNVIFFIETDGHENASREYNAAGVKSLVEKKKEAGWDFNFVGADLDAASTSKMSGLVGIDPSKTMAFTKSAAGYATRNMSFASATTSYIDTAKQKT
jgi:hypothetical protein